MRRFQGQSDSPQKMFARSCEKFARGADQSRVTRTKYMRATNRCRQLAESQQWEIEIYSSQSTKRSFQSEFAPQQKDDSPSADDRKCGRATHWETERQRGTPALASPCGDWLSGGRAARGATGAAGAGQRMRQWRRESVWHTAACALLARESSIGRRCIAALKIGTQFRFCTPSPVAKLLLECVRCGREMHTNTHINNKASALVLCLKFMLFIHARGYKSCAQRIKLLHF